MVKVTFQYPRVLKYTQGLERVFLQACALYYPFLPSFPSLSPAPEGPGGLPALMSPFWFLL